MPAMENESKEEEKTTRKHARNISTMLDDETLEALEQYQKESDLDSRQDAVRALFRGWKRYHDLRGE